MIGNNDIVVGTCGLCGGPVCVPQVYWSTARPVPQCRRCGAYAQENYGPVLPMQPRRPKRHFDEWLFEKNQNTWDDGHKIYCGSGSGSIVWER